MSDKIGNDYNVIKPKSLLIDEVKKTIKADIHQAQKITESVNSNYTFFKTIDDKKHHEAPILRAPLDQKKSNERIDLNAESKYKIKSSFIEDENLHNIKKNKQQSDILSSEDKKEQLLVNQKHFYDDDKSDLPASSPTKEKPISNDISGSRYTITDKPTIENSPTPHSLKNSQDKKKSNEHYDFLYLQLSYQNLINKNILDKIKNSDKLDYYLDKLNKLAKGVDGLKKEFESILENAKKYKDAYIDYWMQIYKEIKEKNLTSASDIAKFLKNKNISEDIINDLMNSHINNRDEMADFLTKHFPFMNLPDDISKYTLNDLDDLYDQLAKFLDNAFRYMPDVTMDQNTLNAITSHRGELDGLLNKKQDTGINNSLASVKEQYRALIGEQNKIELEAMADSLSGMALLTFLLAKVRELTMKVMLERSEGEQKLFDEMQEVTTKTLKDKIADQKAQIKKQQEIQYWAGIGLKILGALLTVIAAVAAIFTAGASLALIGVAVVMMAVSVTLMVADEIYQAVHNSSFMSEAMKPVVEAISKAVEKIADFITEEMEKGRTSMLERFGVDKEVINKINEKIRSDIKMTVEIMIVASLLVGGVALSFVGAATSSTFTNIANNVANKILNQNVKEILKRVLHECMERMLGKMVKQILTEAFEDLLKDLKKFLIKDMVSQGVKIVNRTVIATRLTTASASSIINIYTATITDKIMKSVADSKKLEEILKLIQLLMDQIMESYHENMDTLTNMLQAMSEQSSISNKTKANIVRNISI